MKKTEVSKTRLRLLNLGEAETQHLMEALAMDLSRLFAQVFPALPPPPAELQTLGFTKKMATLGQHLHQCGAWPDLPRLQQHPSDTVRGWACYLIAARDLSIANTLQHIRPLAEDPHFGVREWAWLALREKMSHDLPSWLPSLLSWAQDPSSSANLRRFVSEATRPRGVWCKHLSVLRAQPWLGLPLLEPLRADPSVYVQNSVGNWLNDAGKDHPAWVHKICQEWLKLSPNIATVRICKRAQRGFSL